MFQKRYRTILPNTYHIKWTKAINSASLKITICVIFESLPHQIRLIFALGEIWQVAILFFEYKQKLERTGKIPAIWKLIIYKRKQPVARYIIKWGNNLTYDRGHLFISLKCLLWKTDRSSMWDSYVVAQSMQA